MTLEEVDNVFTAGKDPVKVAREIQKQRKLGLEDGGLSIPMQESSSEAVKVSVEKVG